MSAGSSLKPGQIFEVTFPFYGDAYWNHDETGPYSEECWRPGCKQRLVPPDGCEWVADGEGKMILTVVDVHKPGRYPERVFYTRKWIDPDGREFGKTNLHITTTPTFNRRASGYYHEYKLK